MAHRKLYPNPEDEYEAAIEILLFMQKHEIEDEEMKSFICMIADVEQDRYFWDHFIFAGMKHMRRIANGD